ncbi:MAG TPA: hypothetical protein VKE22_22095 [Haliangiales bacterium]|nr:hypothetical protein [Haliangiales bacterium]
MTLKGSLIASAVAGLFAISAAPAFAGEEKDTDQVKCGGVNSCKGTGACGGADHGCAGKNACKGQGWTKTTRKECKDKGGKVIAAADEKKDEKKK